MTSPAPSQLVQAESSDRHRFFVNLTSEVAERCNPVDLTRARRKNPQCAHQCGNREAFLAKKSFHGTFREGRHQTDVI